MICPKCGKDVGDYKYCPDCAVPAIQVDTPTTPDNSMMQNAAPIPPIVKKKQVSLNRFFSIVMSLQIFCTLCFFGITIGIWVLLDKGGLTVPGGLWRSVTCLLHLISVIICLVFSKHIKFWMLFPCTITGILVVIGYFIFVYRSIGGYSCGTILILPIVLLGLISTIMMPISKIPHKEDA